MHAFMAASPACAFHLMTESPLAVAANAARDRAAPGPGSWVNTPATRAVMRCRRSGMRITPLIFLVSNLHANRLPIVRLFRAGRDRTNPTVGALDRRIVHICEEFL